MFVVATSSSFEPLVSGNQSVSQNAFSVSLAKRSGISSVAMADDGDASQLRVMARVAPLVALSLLGTAAFGILMPVLPILMTEVGCAALQCESRVVS